MQLSVGTVHDITKAKNAQIAEEASRSLHQLIVERSPDAIAILTRDGVIETANSQALELFGYRDPSEIIGRHVMNLVYKDEEARGRRDIKRLVVRGELQDSEHYLVKADGSAFWAEVSGRRLPAVAGAPAAYFVLVRDISKRKILESSLRNLSITDDLTGLYNRRGFTLAAEQELRHAKRTKSGIVFLFFDMDRLKSINDRFGHAEGDLALIQAAELLRSSFRNSDIIGRWGGDEFAVLALDVPSGCVDALHKRLDENISRRNAREDMSYMITFSSGMVRFDPEDPLSLHDMEKLADEMMYSQKSGKLLRTL
jgi:diguanylate cyclase (GGDEF)-like protein/PAS domain S-box-containing protein